MVNAELFKLYRNLTDSRQMVLNEILSRDIDWRHLVEEDLNIEAIHKIRKNHPKLSIKEAKDMVDAYRQM